jgi:dihydroneopterin aldolase
METMSQTQILSQEIRRLIDLVAKDVAAQLHADTQATTRQRVELPDGTHSKNARLDQDVRRSRSTKTTAD